MAKVFFVQTNLEVPTHPFRKLQLWNLFSISELTFSYYNMTLTLKNICLCALDWRDLFHHDIHRQLFPSKLSSFFFKINCCMFNLSFLRRFDGNYRSAIVLFVSHLCGLKDFVMYAIWTLASPVTNAKTHKMSDILDLLPRCWFLGCLPRNHDLSWISRLTNKISWAIR